MSFAKVVPACLQNVVWPLASIPTVRALQTGAKFLKQTLLACKTSVRVYSWKKLLRTYKCFGRERVNCLNALPLGLSNACQFYCSEVREVTASSPYSLWTTTTDNHNLGLVCDTWVPHAQTHTRSMQALGRSSSTHCYFNLVIHVKESVVTEQLLPQWTDILIRAPEAISCFRSNFLFKGQILFWGQFLL